MGLPPGDPWSAGAGGNDRAGPSGGVGLRRRHHHDQPRSSRRWGACRPGPPSPNVKLVLSIGFVEHSIAGGARHAAIYDPSMTPAEYKVLLVDDDPAMLRLLSQWLAKAGYTIRTAADGREALDAIETGVPGLSGDRLGDAADRRFGVVPAGAGDAAAPLRVHRFPDRPDRRRRDDRGIGERGRRFPHQAGRRGGTIGPHAVQLAGAGVGAAVEPVGPHRRADRTGDPADVLRGVGEGVAAVPPLRRR